MTGVQTCALPILYWKLSGSVYLMVSELVFEYLMQCCLEYLMVSELEFEYWKLFGLVYCLGFE